MKIEISQSAREELTAWTILATDGLAKEVRDRVRDEVEDHFRDAVANHLAGGMTAVEAEATALCDLGDIRTAARGFRKRYLTLDDESWLRRMFGPNRTGRKMLGLVIFIQAAFGTFVFAFWDQDRPFGSSELIFLIALWIWSIAFLFTGIRLASLAGSPVDGRTLWRKCLIYELSNSAFYFLASAAWLAFMVTRESYTMAEIWFFSAFGIAAVLTGLSRSFRIWRKLGHDQAVQVTH